MIWKHAADIVSIVHALWVGAFLLGPLWAWKYPVWRGIHWAILIGTAASWSFYCPLTVLENSLLCRYDPGTAYDSGFLEHALKQLIDLRGHGVALAWAVRAWAVVWGLVYVALWARSASRAGKV